MKKLFDILVTDTRVSTMSDVIESVPFGLLDPRYKLPPETKPVVKYKETSVAKLLRIKWSGQICRN